MKTIESVVTFSSTLFPFRVLSPMKHRSDYFNNLAAFKRSSELLSKNRPVPPDGASSLNQSRSPRFSDRYKHRFNGSVTGNQSTTEWYGPKEAEPSM